MRLAIRHTFVFTLLILQSMALAGGGSEGHSGGNSIERHFLLAKKVAPWILTHQDALVDIPYTASTRPHCSPEISQWVRTNGKVLADEIQYSPIVMQDVNNSQCSTTSNETRFATIAINPFACRALIRSPMEAAFEIHSNTLIHFGWPSTQFRRHAKCLEDIFKANYLHSLSKIDPLLGVEESYRNSVKTGSDHSLRLRQYESVEKYLKILYAKAKENIFTTLRNLENIKIPKSLDRQTLQWIFTNRTLLEKDILYTDAVWILPEREGEVVVNGRHQSSCAHTQNEAFAPVHFMISKCAYEIADEYEMIQTIVHESSHHAPFLVVKESFADLIGWTMAELADPSRKQFGASK